MLAKLKVSSLIIIAMLVLAYIFSPWWLVRLAKQYLPEQLVELQANIEYPGLNQFVIQSAQFKLDSLQLKVEISQFSTSYDMHEIAIGSILISHYGDAPLEDSGHVNASNHSDNPLNTPFELISQVLNHVEGIKNIQRVKIEKLSYLLPMGLKEGKQKIVIEDLNLQHSNKKLKVTSPLIQLPKQIQQAKLPALLSKPGKLDFEVDFVKDDLIAKWHTEVQTLGSMAYSKNQKRESFHLTINSKLLESFLSGTILDGAKMSNDLQGLSIVKMADTEQILLQSQSELTLDPISLNQLLSSSRGDLVRNNPTLPISALEKIESSVDLTLQLNDNKVCTVTRACEFSLLIKFNSPIVVGNSDNRIVVDNVAMNFDSKFSYEDITSLNSMFDLLQGKLHFSADKLLWQKTNQSTKTNQGENPEKLNRSSVTIADIDVKLIPSFPQAPIARIVSGHWSLKAEASAAMLDATLKPQDFAKETNQLDTIPISVIASAGGAAEFNIINQEEIVSSGNMTLSALEINSTYGTSNATANLIWRELNPRLSHGNASARLDLQAPTVSEFTFDTALITADIEPSNETIHGEIGFAFNDIPMSPIEIKYSKTDQSTALLFTKEEVNLEVVNHLLSIVGEQQKIPLQILEGSLTHSGDVLLAKSALLSSQLEADKITVLFGENKVKGLKLNQLVTSISPKVFRSNLQIESIDFSSGLQISEISTKIEGRLINDKESLEFSQLDAKIFQGKLTANSVRFVELQMQPSVVALTGLSINELFNFMDVAGLQAEGKIDLNIPISSANGQLVVKDGKFHSVGKGIIQYLPNTEQTQSEKNIVFQALENFHYESFDGDISYDKDGHYLIKLHLLGSNPEFYDGYPIDFTLNLNGQLTGIFRSLFLTGNFEQAVLEQVEAQRKKQTESF